MDNNRFKSLIDKEKNSSNTIGTLSERTLHRVVKNYYEDNEQYQEVKIGSYFCDILKDNQIIEIQTRQFFKLVPKIDFFLENGYNVKVVFPTFHEKTLYWVNKTTGEVSKGRKSNKKGTIFDCFKELYNIKKFLKNNHFSFTIILMDLNEYRLLDGWNITKKRGSHRIDRIPNQIVNEVDFLTLNDYNLFHINGLSNTFTSNEYAKLCKISLKNAQMGLNILNYCGIIQNIGKEGRKILYKWNC